MTAISRAAPFADVEQARQRLILPYAGEGPLWSIIGRVISGRLLAQVLRGWKVRPGQRQTQTLVEEGVVPTVDRSRSWAGATCSQGRAVGSTLGRMGLLQGERGLVARAGCSRGSRSGRVGAACGRMDGQSWTARTRTSKAAQNEKTQQKRPGSSGSARDTTPHCRAPPPANDRICDRLPRSAAAGVDAKPISG